MVKIFLIGDEDFSLSDKEFFHLQTILLIYYTKILIFYYIQYYVYINQIFHL